MAAGGPIAKGRACAGRWGGVIVTLDGMLACTSRTGTLGTDATTPRGLVSTGAQQQAPSCMQAWSTGTPWRVASPGVPGIPVMPGIVSAPLALVATTCVCIVDCISHDISGAGWARIATNHTAQHLAISRDQREWDTAEG
jgi:hypothetical protein